METPSPDLLRARLLPEELPLTTLRTGETDIQLSEAVSILQQIPQVDEVVLVPSPDLDKGWMPIAYITTRSPVSPREIYDYAVSHMPQEAMVPQGIRLVNQLPRGIDGKVHYYQLTSDEIRTEIQRLIGKGDRGTGNRGWGEQEIWGRMEGRNRDVCCRGGSCPLRETTDIAGGD